MADRARHRRHPDVLRFFYYLVHRFLFHDEGFIGGPLIWVHAVHHRQHNPGRGDSSYIHPLEAALGLGLYAASIFVPSRLMGEFHVVTIVITWISFAVRLDVRHARLRQRGQAAGKPEGRAEASLTGAGRKPEKPVYAHGL